MDHVIKSYFLLNPNIGESLKQIRILLLQAPEVGVVRGRGQTVGSQPIRVGVHVRIILEALWINRVIVTKSEIREDCMIVTGR